MSSTNKTTNYELSQFVGSDKPAWLSDYNTDMGKIDTGIHNAATTATAADGKADAANTAIGSLASLTTDEKTSLVGAINEVDSHADAAQVSANSAYLTASGAATDATKALGILNFDVGTSLTFTGGFAPSSNSLKIYKNSDGSLAKISGHMEFNAPQAGSFTVSTADTGLRPAAQIVLTDVGFIQEADTGYMRVTDVTVNTDGTLTIGLYGKSSGALTEYISMPCILQIKTIA